MRCVRVGRHSKEEAKEGKIFENSKSVIKVTPRKVSYGAVSHFFMLSTLHSKLIPRQD